MTLLHLNSLRSVTLAVLCGALLSGSPARAEHSVALRSPVVDASTARETDARRPSAPFQVAFTTRLQSVSFNEDFTVLNKAGQAESIQTPTPGVFIGSYLEQILLTDPGTDFSRGLFKLRETLTTGFGTITWEAVVLVLDTGEPFYGQIGWTRGQIVAGTGSFRGATGTVEIAGRNAGCDPTVESFCVPLADNPSLGQRQDFNFIIRGRVSIGG